MDKILYINIRASFCAKDRQPGVNFPPLHPWCRCTFTIEVEDWDAWMDEYERKHGNLQDPRKIADRLTDDSKRKYEPIASSSR